MSNALHIIFVAIALVVGAVLERLTRKYGRPL